jgi:hypothetical protein
MVMAAYQSPLISCSASLKRFKASHWSPWEGDEIAWACPAAILQDSSKFKPEMALQLFKLAHE